MRIVGAHQHRQGGGGGEAGLGERGGGGGGSGGGLLMRGSLSWVSHGSQTRKRNINLNTRSIPRADGQ